MNDTVAPLGVVCLVDECLDKARAIAARLGAPLSDASLLKLLVNTDGLSLVYDQCNPIAVDFFSKDVMKRVKAGANQPLIRATGANRPIQIIDATAGLGRDAATLAHFGAEVLMLERNPLVSLLLEQAMVKSTNRLRLSLEAVDALVYLQALEPQHYPDVIYLDPMHPARKKSARVKKEMQALQYYLGEDHDASALLAVAKQRVKSRVVVKWPAREAPLDKPNYSFEGKTIRFDVFLPERSEL